MSENLLPCPFCGGTATIERYGNSRQSTVYQCEECSCRLETGEMFDHGVGWNTREPSKAPSEPHQEHRNTNDA